MFCLGSAENILISAALSEAVSAVGLESRVVTLGLAYSFKAELSLQHSADPLTKSRWDCDPPFQPKSMNMYAFCYYNKNKSLLWE